MFAIGFLILAGLFFLVFTLLSKLLPPGRWRTTFVFSILTFVASYPFLYLASPSYAKFKELCQRPNTKTILKTKEVNFIYLNWGYGSDCTEGPKIVGRLGFAGFDCVKRDHEGTGLYRFTKKANWTDSCGLECFEMTAIAAPEAKYDSQDRYGYFDGDNRVITYGGGLRKEIPMSENLMFSDWILMDEGEGEMAYTTRYFYHPYGTGWARILGMASGSAPVEECTQRSSSVAPEEVYKPRRDLPAGLTNPSTGPAAKSASGR